MDKEQIYLVAGTLVVANIGTIITVLISAFKLASTFGKMQLQIEMNKKDVSAAHERLRKIESEKRDLLKDC